MNFEELEKLGSLRKDKSNFRQVRTLLDRSEEDLATSKSNLQIDTEWAYAIAYHAMLRAGRALMISFGYRPAGKDQHKTIVLFTKALFGTGLKDLIGVFDRMRRKRHDFIYEPDRPITRQEAEQGILDAEALLGQIKAIVREKDPQKGMGIYNFKGKK
ncbi:MAG: HEPN domain-containing protein [Candidatus Aminicenantes bacterium]|nr:HEPN domain-containing protein [Candidatus Aminicenantes bacterium]